MLLGKVALLHFVDGIFKWDDSGFYLNLVSHLLKNKVMKKTERRSTKNI